MSKPVFHIILDHDEGTVSLGNDEIGLQEMQLSGPETVEWAENLRDLLEEHGFSVEYEEES